MKKKTIYCAIYYLTIAILVTMLLVNVVSLFLDIDKLLWLRIVSIALILLLLFVDLGLYSTAKWLVERFAKKQRCEYISKQSCPYGEKDECPYDTSLCYAFKDFKPIKKKAYVISSMLFFAIVITVLGELIDENVGLADFLKGQYDFKTVIKIFQPIANSIIAAIITAFIIDIPERIKEYKNFFVDILTSFDYLKRMKEEDLTELRKRVTWQLHVKDFPHMAEGLIDLDERFCKMLKRPYFKEYSQIINVAKDGDKLRKSIKIEYFAVNPQRSDSTINMDIGIGNFVKFTNQEKFVEEAKNLFVLKKYSVSFEKDNKEYDLLKLVDIMISTDTLDGLEYNGKISVGPKEEISNENLPISLTNLKNLDKQKKEEIKYVSIDKNENVRLMASFKNLMHIKLEYEILVPNDDVIYTKRLRYPVKLFSLDYSLDKSVADLTLEGQLIGTLIDQTDVTIDKTEDKKRITMRTHNWLLPKNGAVIFHCKA